MKFGEAVELAKQGARIARQGWNGKGMWLAYMPPMDVAEDKVTPRLKPFIPTGSIRVGAYFGMMTAQGTWQPGWLASQPDMLSEDWEAYPAAPSPVGVMFVPPAPPEATDAQLARAALEDTARAGLKLSNDTTETAPVTVAAFTFPNTP